MCFRPPEFSQLMTKCPACETFNPPKLEKCKKCGAELPKADPKDAKAVKAGPGANAGQPQVKRTTPPK